MTKVEKIAEKVKERLTYAKTARHVWIDVPIDNVGEANPMGFTLTGIMTVSELRALAEFAAKKKVRK